MFSELLITHCAPTLAGMKPGSLFSMKTSPVSARFYAAMWNCRLSRHGVQIMILCQKRGRTLFYVYRPAELQCALSEKQRLDFLSQFGYRANASDLSGILEFMQKRVREAEDFPHEIGVFLGYPLDDVCGFIRYQGQNYKFCGLWKVYGDVKQARDLFRKYEACQAHYRQLFHCGWTVTSLAAAS